MSLMGMNRAFKKHGAIYASALALLMLVGVALSGLGSNIASQPGADPSASGVNGEAGTEVAVIGGQPVYAREIDAQIDRVFQQQGQQVPPQMRDQYRVLLLDQFKQQRAIEAAAKAAGVTVNPSDIEKAREEVWTAQKTQYASALGLKPDATDNDIDAALRKQGAQISVAMLKGQAIPEDQLRTKILNDGLTKALKAEVKVDEAFIKRTYNDIQVRHILIASGAQGLPEAQAKTKAEKILAEIKADPSKFATLAQNNSDDPGSKAKGGYYDWSPASKYVPEFTQAALAAGVGKVYPELVKTQFGYHIIKLEGERPGKTLPKDWDTKKQQYVDQYVNQVAGSRVADAIQKQLPGITVEVKDPGMRATQLETEAQPLTDKAARNTKLQAALDELSKVKDDQDGAVALRKAKLYQQLGQPEKAIVLYEESLKNRNALETRLELADLYVKNKNNAKAIAQIKEADKLSIPNVAFYYQITSLLNRMGEKEMAKQYDARAAEMIKRQEAMQKAEQERMKEMMPPSPAPSPAAAAASPAPAVKP